MIYLSNEPYPQEISVPRSFGVIVPQRNTYLSTADIATDLTTDSDTKVLAASQGVVLKEMVDAKADASGVYTKTEVDAELALKADADDVYTKQEVDEALAEKADVTDIPTKTSDLQNDSGFVTGQEVSQTYETKSDATAKETALQNAINTKQETLVSGQNIKTINGEALLGGGNLVIQGGDPNAVTFTPQILTDEQKAQARTNIGAGTYSKPANGIPESDLAGGVQASLGKADTALQSEADPVFTASPAYGITLEDIAAWDAKYTKPATGIPASDLASGVIPDVSDFVTDSDLATALADYWLKSDVVNIALADIAISGDWEDILNNPIPTPSASDNGKVLGVVDAQGNLGWVQGGGGGGGSVTSVGLSVPTGLEVSGSPVTSSGTLAVSFQTGYSIPTDAKQSGWDAKYDKPSGGIPKTDLAAAVQDSLDKADTAVQTEADPVFTASPAAGITASDITAWNGKYTKPATGIPASDIESGVIPSVESLTTAEIDTIWNAAI